MMELQQAKMNALVVDNSKALDVVSGLTLGIVTAYLPFTLTLGLSRMAGFTSQGDVGTIQIASVVGLAVVACALPVAIEARKSAKMLTIASAMVFAVLGFCTALTF